MRFLPSTPTSTARACASCVQDLVCSLSISVIARPCRHDPHGFSHVLMSSPPATDVAEHREKNSASAVDVAITDCVLLLVLTLCAPRKRHGTRRAVPCPSAPCRVAVTLDQERPRDKSLLDFLPPSWMLEENRAVLLSCTSHLAWSRPLFGLAPVQLRYVV